MDGGAQGNWGEAVFESRQTVKVKENTMGPLVIIIGILLCIGGIVYTASEKGKVLKVLGIDTPYPHDMMLLDSVIWQYETPLGRMDGVLGALKMLDGRRSKHGWILRDKDGNYWWGSSTVVTPVRVHRDGDTTD